MRELWLFVCNFYSWCFVIALLYVVVIIWSAWSSPLSLQSVPSSSHKLMFYYYKQKSNTLFWTVLSECRDMDGEDHTIFQMSSVVRTISTKYLEMTWVSRLHRRDYENQYWQHENQNTVVRKISFFAREGKWCFILLHYHIKLDKTANMYSFIQLLWIMIGDVWWLMFVSTCTTIPISSPGHCALNCIAFAFHSTGSFPTYVI